MTTVTRRAADWRAPNWRSVGACLHADPNLFFPVSVNGHAAEQIAKAKTICAGCKVRVQCLEFAQANDVIHGIWGGTTPEERQRVRRRERRAARDAKRAGARLSVRTPE